MFCACAWIFTEKNATSKIIKKSPKNQFPPGGAVFALAPPSPKPTPPKGHFWRYLRCFMHIEQSSKMTVFLPPGRGSAAAARPPIAKAKAKPHAMRSNMPGIRCLVHRRIEGLPPMPPTPESQLLQGHLCQPDTQERWNSTVQNAPPHQKPTSRQPMRHSQTPPRHEPKPAKSAQKLSNAAFWCPKERWTSTVQRRASLGLALEASRGTVQHASETGKPQQDSSPTSQTRSAKKLSNVTFWWPKERWNSTVQNAPPHQKPTSRQPMRNNQTTKHHLETSPNQPKPRKERWNSTVQNAPPHQKPSKTNLSAAHATQPNTT